MKYGAFLCAINLRRDRERSILAPNLAEKTVKNAHPEAQSEHDHDNYGGVQINPLGVTSCKEVVLPS